MSKFNKDKKAKKAPAKPTYAYEEYQKEVTTITGFFVDTVKSIKENNKILLLATDLLDKNEELSEEDRVVNREIIDNLIELTNQSINTLEETKVRLLDCPDYFAYNDKKVVEWAADIQLAILESSSWLADTAPIYMALFDLLGLDKNLEVPAIVTKGK